MVAIGLKMNVLSIAQTLTVMELLMLLIYCLSLGIGDYPILLATSTKTAS